MKDFKVGFSSIAAEMEKATSSANVIRIVAAILTKLAAAVKGTAQFTRKRVSDRRSSILVGQSTDIGRIFVFRNPVGFAGEGAQTPTITDSDKASRCQD